MLQKILIFPWNATGGKITAWESEITCQSLIVMKLQNQILNPDLTEKFVHAFSLHSSQLGIPAIRNS